MGTATDPQFVGMAFRISVVLAFLVCVTGTLAETVEDAHAEMHCNQGSHCDQTEHEDEMSALQQSTAKVPVDDLPDDPLGSELQEDDTLSKQELDAITEEEEPSSGVVNDVAGDAAD